MGFFNPPIHHTTHEPGGLDAIVALDGSVLTTGAVPAARGGTGVTTGLTALDGGNITTGLITDARLSTNIPRLNAASNTFAVPGSGNDLYIQAGGYNRFGLIDTSQTANARRFELLQVNQVLYLAATDDGWTPQAAMTMNRSGDVTVGRYIYEKQRTTPLGHWIAIAYSAGLFSATTGTWTVEAGDFSGLAYALSGKTMFLTFILNTTSVSATPSALTIALPAGLSAAVSYTPFWYYESAT